MRGALTLLVLACLQFAHPAAAQSVTVSATLITSFRGANYGEQVGAVTFRGGLVLTGNHPDFGGLSSLTFLDSQRFLSLTDKGRFVSGTLQLADGRPSAITAVTLSRMLNSGGTELPNKYSSDSEALDLIIRNGSAAAVRVGFEGLTRVADFDLTNGLPGGPARPIAVPDWMSALKGEDSIESLCIAPPASPVAGSTLLITEELSREPGTWAATLLGVADKGDLHLKKEGGVNPTDCAFLPNGDLLVLERAFSFLTFTVQIRRIPAAMVRAGSIMDGEVLLRASGGEVDNFEGLAVRSVNGETRLTILSDNNFNGIQRTLLLDFAL